MLNRSLVLSGSKGSIAQKASLLAARTNQNLNLARQKHISSSRNVATTPSSKGHQVARRRERDRLDEEEAQHATGSAHGAQKYRARLEHLNLWHSLDTIKRLGHRLSKLDPLQLNPSERLHELTWSHQLIEQLRSNKEIVQTEGFLNTRQPVMAVNELIESVWNIYANSGCGLEFSHMSNQFEIEWLTSQWERLNEFFHLSRQDEQNLAKLLLECEAFDHFMAAKYPTTKRYGCEGAESMLVVFDEILRLCHLGQAEVDEMTKSIGAIDNVIIGMPHRGRLNLLACLLGFEPGAIFSKTRGQPELDLREAWMAKGDVLSHLSTNMRFVYGLDRQHIGLSRDTPEPINVTLLPNPSHLEVSSPMVVGSARGRAHNILHEYSSSPRFTSLSNNKSKQSSDNINKLNYEQHFSTILPVQVHGDAAVAGQGIIQETLQMANLANFSVGGSLHLVVNNQIGYTTPSSAGRSARNCTDIFKLIEAPIIHVNAENISSVIRATRLALTYRQKFAKDIAINLICYRQHGHNEMDEPSFTQPVMYGAIRARKSIPQSFCDQISFDKEQRQQIVNNFKDKLNDAHKRSDLYKPDNDNYRNFSLPTEFHRDHICSWETGFDLSELKSIALASVSTPPGFNVHPNLSRVLVEERRERFNVDDLAKLAQVKVDWATAEILAFGSLLKQNQSVRIAGQDVARGTFSTRHAILYDQTTGESYTPLNEMICDREKQRAKLEVANTILSEEAAMAYEFAYSTETCALTIWEAQFGDFFNTAQSIIDTLVSSSESKWLKQSPLTLLLPHGLDGAGPEHSSAHIERFLQMSSSSVNSIDTEANVNWSICFPTQPSQYFHLLRRQVMRPFRKPLVVMSPKVIFRHPGCVSELAHFALEQSFKPVLEDESANESLDKIDTIALCSGKVYFLLKEEKLKRGLNNVALVRVEELCPFPIKSLVETIQRYPNVKHDKLVWVQEEHRNQGAFSYVEARLSALAGIKLRYVGRAESELPATGCTSQHKRELDQLLRDFQNLGPRK